MSSPSTRAAASSVFLESFALASSMQSGTSIQPQAVTAMPPVAVGWLAQVTSRLEPPPGAR
jgi:hypothetical protein